MPDPRKWPGSLNRVSEPTWELKWDIFSPFIYRNFDTIFKITSRLKSSRRIKLPSGFPSKISLASSRVKKGQLLHIKSIFKFAFWQKKIMVNNLNYFFNFRSHQKGIIYRITSKRRLAIFVETSLLSVPTVEIHRKNPESTKRKETRAFPQIFLQLPKM